MAHYVSWRLLALLLAVLSPAPLYAAQIRTACNADEGNLEKDTPDVKFDNPHFEVGGTKFAILVFSLANPASWASNFICLRYELENAGTALIPLVYWDLLDDWNAPDLGAGERRARTRRRPSATKAAVEGPTVIKAFRSEEITTVAWQTFEDWQRASKRASALEPDPTLRFEASSAGDPAAARA